MHACPPRDPPQTRYDNVDLVTVRENTEGEYAQVGGFVYQQQPEEIAIQTSVFTRRGIERIVRFAFELAVTLARSPLPRGERADAAKDRAG